MIVVIPFNPVILLIAVFLVLFSCKSPVIPIILGIPVFQSFQLSHPPYLVVLNNKITTVMSITLDILVNQFILCHPSIYSHRSYPSHHSHSSYPRHPSHLSYLITPFILVAPVILLFLFITNIPFTPVITVNHVILCILVMPVVLVIPAIQVISLSNGLPKNNSRNQQVAANGAVISCGESTH